jgi:hypothetical protein
MGTADPGALSRRVQGGVAVLVYECARVELPTRSGESARLPLSS